MQASNTKNEDTAHTHPDPQSAPSTSALARQREDVSVMESVRWPSLCLAAVLLGNVIGRVFANQDPLTRLVLWLDGSALLLNGILALCLFRRTLPARWAQPVCAILALSTALDILLSTAIRHTMSALVNVPVVLVALGAIFLSTYWLSFVTFTIVLAAIPVALRVLPEAYVLDYFVCVASALVLGANVFVHRLCAYRNVLRSRVSDLRLDRPPEDARESSSPGLLERQQTDRRREELEGQLRQAQKLEAVGVLAGGVAHDMNNVLGIITSIASLTSARIEAGSPLAQDITDILAAARRGSALTRNLLGFARQGTRLRERCHVEATVEAIVHLLRRTVSKQITLHVSTAADLDDVVADPDQLSQVVMNLCINAVDATQGRGTITIRSTNLWVDTNLALMRDIPEGRYIELTVEDDGCGIPKDVLPRVFEPFFSTKSSYERSGLGLSMVYGTVRHHGGAVVIESTAGRGTKVRVLLPSQVEQPTSALPVPAQAIRPSETRRTILLVDDEPMLRSAGRRIIKSLGFEALVAANGAEAVAVFRRQREKISLVVLDVAMPVMGGRDCFSRLRELEPDLPVLLASGYAKHGEVDELLAAGAAGYLSKPYDCGQMADAIHRCLSLSQVMTVADSTPGDDPSRRGTALP